LADCPGEIRQALDVIQREIHTCVAHQKEPVSAPGYIAEHLAVSWNVNLDICRQPVAGNVIHSHFAAGVKDGANGTYRSFEAMFT
jgi:hypothetical protein